MKPKGVLIWSGNPKAEDWAQIGKLIEDGWLKGEGVPNGINWEVEK